MTKHANYIMNIHVIKLINLRKDRKTKIRIFSLLLSFFLFCYRFVGWNGTTTEEARMPLSFFWLASRGFTYQLSSQSLILPQACINPSTVMYHIQTYFGNVKFMIARLNSADITRMWKKKIKSQCFIHKSILIKELKTCMLTV